MSTGLDKQTGAKKTAETSAQVDALVSKYGNLPVLSIKQPWAWLILNAGKDIENRSWPTHFTGRFFIHTGKTFDNISPVELRHLLHGEAYEDLCASWNKLLTGGIVGVSTIIDCVNYHPSKWFAGDWGFVLKDSMPVDFVPLRGKLGFFNVSC